MKGPTVQQKKFADYKLSGMSGTRAAEAAGYTGNDATLAATASRLLKDSKVLLYMEQVTSKNPRVLGRDELLEFWSHNVLNESEAKERRENSKLLGAAQGVFITKVQADVNMTSASRDELLEGLPEAIRALAPNKETRERIAAVLAEMEQGEK